MIIIIIIIVIVVIPWEFFTSANTDSISLRFEWQQVSRTLLNILADLNNAVVWMVSTHSFISKSSSPCINPLVTVPRAPITIGIIIIFIFHSFYNSQARSRYLSLFALSFSFTLWSAGTAKFTILQVFFLLLIIIRCGHLVETRWSICISKLFLLSLFLFLLLLSLLLLLLLNHHHHHVVSLAQISLTLSPLFPIIHRFWQVFRATSHILT